MGDKTGINFPEITAVVDRGGRRIRLYRRKNTDRPGMAERKKMAAIGKKWCSGCRDWHDSAEITKQGECRNVTNRKDRLRYASNNIHREKIKNRANLRKRGISIVPQEARDLLHDEFMGECAYCDNPATTFDHVTPVSAGGQTEPDNILPACIRCNSSKKAKSILQWIPLAPKVKPYTLDKLAFMGHFNEVRK